MTKERIKVRVQSRQQLMSSVATRWDEQYKSRFDMLDDPDVQVSGAEKLEEWRDISRKLHAYIRTAGGGSINREGIDQIIGNGSWTINCCSYCERDVEIMLRIRRHYDHDDSSGTPICTECVNELAYLFNVLKTAGYE